MKRVVDGSRRARWDFKHRESGEIGIPSSFLIDIAGILPSGRCLDLAAGRGANAALMVELGYDVEAIDWSFEGLSMVRTRRSELKAIVADLANYPLPIARYDVVLCFRYLDRDIWPAMVRSLKPGGALVVETFTVDYLKLRPEFAEAFCLRSNELRSAFPGLRLDVYREREDTGLASFLGFKPSRE
jgi:SAM-dependent methyltransferase